MELTGQDGVRSRFSPEQRRVAQRNIAGLAAAHPDLQGDDRRGERVEWLAEVLACLGLDTVIEDEEELFTCEAPGERRGYNLHLTRYTKLCTPCARWRADNVTPEAYVAQRREQGDGGKSSVRMR